VHAGSTTEQTRTNTQTNKFITNTNINTTNNRIDNGADPILEDTQLMNAADLAGRAGRRSSATFLEGQPSLLGSPEQLRRQIIGGRGRRGSRDIGAEMARLPVAKCV